MNVLKTVILISLILLPAWGCIQAVDSQVVENGYGIVRGPGYAFTLKAPSGWVIDAVSGVEQGLPAVFYPRGATWSESPAVAYARARPKTKEVSTIDRMVQAAVAALRAQGNPEYNATFEEFDRIVGLDRIRAFHLNDSVKDLGSRVDRHARREGERGRAQLVRASPHNDAHPRGRALERKRTEALRGRIERAAALADEYGDVALADRGGALVAGR